MNRKNRWEVNRVDRGDLVCIDQPVVDWNILRAMMREGPPPAAWKVLDYFIKESQRLLNAGHGAGGSGRLIPVRGGYAALAKRCGVKGDSPADTVEAAVHWLGRGVAFGGGVTSTILWMQGRYRGTMYFSVPFLWCSAWPHGQLKYGELLATD